MLSKGMWGNAHGVEGVLKTVNMMKGQDFFVCETPVKLHLAIVGPTCNKGTMKSALLSH